MTLKSNAGNPEVDDAARHRTLMASLDEDRRAIEALRERDRQAVLAGDFETLRSVLDDEAVILPPGGAAQRGKPDLDRAFARMAEAPHPASVVDYRFEFEELRIFGDFAVEWGSISGRRRKHGSDEVEASRYHVMRILRRQPDGGWKVFRSIWAPAPG